MSKNTLGLIMILRNEAHNLDRSLGPCAKYFDEIVVVDTGSNDGTGEMCAQMGAKVFNFTWVDDFAKARNFSIAKAESKWLFWLDGDNAVSGWEINHLRQALPLDGPAIVWAMEKVESTGGLLWQKRCFPNQDEVRFQGRVHEQLSHPETWPFVASKMIVKHWGYDDPDKVKAKGKYYLGLLEKMLTEDPSDYYAHFQAARCLINLRDFQKASIHLKKMITDQKIFTANSQLWAHGHFLLAQCFKRQGHVNSALNLLQGLLAQDPKNSLGHFHLGRLAYDLKNWQQAKYHFERSLRLDIGAPVVDLDPVAFEFQARYFLGRSLEKTGQKKQAIVSLQKALMLMPQKTTVHTELARIFLSLNERKAAKRHLAMVLAQRPEDKTAQRLLFRIKEAA